MDIELQRKAKSLDGVLELARNTKILGPKSEIDIETLDNLSEAGGSQTNKKEKQRTKK